MVEKDKKKEASPKEKEVEELEKERAEDVEEKEDVADKKEVEEKVSEGENSDKEENESSESELETDTDDRDSKRDASMYFADQDSAVTIEKRFSYMRVLFFTIVVIVSALVFFAVMLYMQSTKEMPSLPNFDFINKFTSPSPTPTPQPSPTPTPEPISLEEYSVSVLNGSGVSGAAGEAGSILEEEGFEEVSAGNADSQDYETTEVQMRESVPEEVFDVLVEALTEYTLTRGEALDDDAEFDIVITLGSAPQSDE